MDVDAAGTGSGAEVGTVENGVGEWPAFWAAFTPERPVLRHGDRVVTWAELEEHVAGLAGGLLRAGIRRGDRVGFLARNMPEFFVVLLAAARIGAAFVPFNVRLSPREMAHISTDAGLRLLVAESHFAERLDRVAAGAEQVYLIDPAPGERGMADLIGPPLSHAEPAARLVTPDDPLVLVYTSGTTGAAKAAVITHGNAASTAVAVINVDGIGPSDAIVVPAPLAFAGSVLSLGMPMLLAGACMVIERDVDPVRLLDLIESGAVTMTKLVPVIYQMMAATPGFEGRDLGGLRSATCGGAPVSDDLLATFQAKGVSLSSAYGLTEGCGYNLGLPPEHARDRIGWAGLPLPFQRCRVVDDDGLPVPAGTVGELIISGACVMAGYWNAPDLTAAVVRGGWLHTGDLAVADEQGYVRIVDRKKDMLISGGINVYPAEVERVLVAHPDVVDVAVVGVPDPRWGEAPAACVVSSDPGLSLERLTTGVTEDLADYKRPRHLLLLDELPRNPNGKILKRVLREMAVRRTGSGDPTA